MDITDVRRIAHEFGIGGDTELISAERGEWNEVVLFSVPGGEYALRRRSKSAPELPSVAFDAEFMEKLAAAQSDVHVPFNVRTKSGTLLFEDAQATYNLQTLVPGMRRFGMWYETDTVTAEDVREIFRTLGILHRACRTISMTNAKPSPTVPELLEQFEAAFGHSELLDEPLKSAVVEKHEYILEHIADIRQVLHDSEYEKFPLFPVHYDLNVNNALWDSGRIVSLVDFDWAQYATFGFDFARTAMLSCGGYKAGGSASNAFDPALVRAALGAYNAVADEPLDDEPLVARLLDASSLFISHWAVSTFAHEHGRAEFLLSIFQTGIERLRPLDFGE